MSNPKNNLISREKWPIRKTHEDECALKPGKCLLCDHENCGWCPECNPQVPEWTIQ